MKQQQTVKHFEYAERICTGDEAHESDMAAAQAITKRDVRRAVGISLAMNALLFAAKLAAVIMSNSLAIITSLVDSGVDLASSIIVWLANVYIRRRNPYVYPEGRMRLEPVAVLILSVVMEVASAFIIVTAIQRLTDPSSPAPTVDAPTIAIMVATIVIKFALYVYCRRIDSLSTRALAQDHMNDVVSNIVSLVTAFLGARVWKQADPIGAISICLYIMWDWFQTGSGAWRVVPPAAGESGAR